MKSAVKRVLGQTIFSSRMDSVLLRDVALVVVFHRVQEVVESDDGLTVTVGMLERHCRFLRRHFQVVPLRDVVDKLEKGRPLNRELAITFDDGYRDNFEVAAPVLEKLSLPATFFVTTQSIGTDVVPWWDEERGARHAWMTWDHVRELHRRGFDIGAHTRTHADLGRVSGAEAEREIVGGRLEIEREIGAPVDLFAYPYGGAAHMSDANRELVRASGFRCCCSSSGGINATGGSPFHLRRVPITLWHRSPHQLGFEVALHRTVVSAPRARSWSRPSEENDAS